MKKEQSFINISDKTLASRLGYGVNFDVVRKQVQYQNQNIVFYFLSSLVSQDAVNDILENIHKKDLICNGSVDFEQDINVVESQVQAGMLAILNYPGHKYLVVDVRSYPDRSSQEPESEKSVKGSHDGFTEHMLTNTALIRRRIKSRNFRVELLQIGELSKTYVNVYYIENRVNKQVYQEVMQKLKNIDIDSLTMTDRALAEILFQQTFNVFPVVRFTERPDIAAIHILKGYLVLMIDTSPGAIIVPTTFFELCQQPMEYHFSPIISSFGRLLRYFSIFIAMFLVPLWFLVASDPSIDSNFLILNESLSRQELFIQILVVELFLSFIRLASFNTPGLLSTSMSLAATIILSEVAASIGLVQGEVVFYCALSSLAAFGIPSFEVSRAVTLWNFLFVLAIGFFNKIGFIVMSFILFLTLVSIQNYGSAYLYPFLPFSLQDFLKTIFRVSSDSKYTTKVK